MNSLIAIQGWLYNGMASGLGDVAGGDVRAVFVAMAAAVLFGAVHAMMPGHGKTVLDKLNLCWPRMVGMSGNPCHRCHRATGSLLCLRNNNLAVIKTVARGFATAPMW